MNRFVKDPEAHAAPIQQMQELHARIDGLITFASEGKNEINAQTTGPEATAAQALRCMSVVKLNRSAHLRFAHIYTDVVVAYPLCSARIKLHRYSAFSDLPVFTKPYCDLKQAPTNFDMGFVEDLAEWLTSCACDGQSQANSNMALDQYPSSEPHELCCKEASSSSVVLPFSKHESSRICLASALNIAQAFEALPYPPAEGGIGSLSSVPRTLPSFACCAMQGAYALLMVCNQAWAMQTGAMPATQHPQRLLAQCEQGLYSILNTLDNYATAFEAIRGMRGLFSARYENCCVTYTDSVILTDQVLESIDGFANLFAGNI